MDKISFSTVEAQCGALSEFIDLLVNRQEGYNISIKPVDDGFDVEFTKEGKFPPTHVDTNPEMRKRGIKCVRTQDREARKKEKFIK